jgi:tRNA threonylcarbamoyladenosine biosynthesis protein TsaB
VQVLSLDTTTRAGSVAIVDDEKTLDERIGDPARPHAERLPGEITALLEAHHLTLDAIELFAVASGPGSFTGLRIGIATMQALAFVERRPIVGISALDALAHTAARDANPGTVVAAWMDAYRRDVFAALYRVADAALFEPDRLVELEAPTVGDPAGTLARWRDALGHVPAIIVGDGAVAFADVIGREAPGARIGGPPPIAATIARLAFARARRGEAVDPAAIHPLYVRRPDAEVAREHAR